MTRRGRKKGSREQWGKAVQQRSGLWQASYVHGGIRGVVSGTRYSAPHTFQTEGAARVWLQTEKDLIDSGKWTSPAQRAKEKLEAELTQQNTLTFGDYAEQFMSTRNVRATSLRRERKLLDYYIVGKQVPAKFSKPAEYRTRRGLGDVKLDELTMDRIEKWWFSLPLDQHRRSCDMAYQLVKQICRKAVRRGLMEKIPCDVDGAGKQSNHSHKPALSPAQVDAIADFMTPLRYRLVVMMGAWCTMRIGEVLELRLGDVSLIDSVIHIRRGVSNVNGEMLIGPPKTAKGVREVPIPAPLQAEIEHHIQAHMSDLADDALLFVNEQGTYVKDFDKKMRRACERAGVPYGRNGGYTFHDLRHTGLTYYREAGASIPDLQAIAGHTTANMVMRYQERIPGSLRMASERVGAIITESRQHAPLKGNL